MDIGDVEPLEGRSKLEENSDSVLGFVALPLMRFPRSIAISAEGGAAKPQDFVHVAPASSHARASQDLIMHFAEGVVETKIVPGCAGIGDWRLAHEC